MPPWRKSRGGAAPARGRPANLFDATPFSIDKAQNNRLAARHEMMVARNGDCFAGKRVLDLASHDGRWSWAALRAGATHVTGVEGRPDLVDKSAGIFDELSIDQSSHEFVCADVFDYLAEASAENRRWDTVLCLGLFYHVMDHYRLLRLMTEVATESLIMDTGLVDTSEPVIRLVMEDTGMYLNAISQFEGQEKAVVGYCSRGALRIMARSLGWNLQFVEWRKEDFADLNCLQDYFSRGEEQHRRFTAVLRPKG